MKNISCTTLLTVLLILLPSCGGGGGGGSSCGGAGCEAGKFCHFTDLSCGAGDAEGSCEDLPLNCESQAVTTVCSCEGLTFFNECYANAASQSVRGPGECV